MCVSKFIVNFLLVFALIRDAGKGHNLYKPRIPRAVAQLHPLVILTATVSFANFQKTASYGLWPHLRFFRSTKVTLHWPPVCLTIQPFAQLHCELPKDPTKTCLLSSCVFYFSFKINSLIFEGQVPP